jgi:hypothetical protein
VWHRRRRRRGVIAHLEMGRAFLLVSALCGTSARPPFACLPPNDHFPFCNASLPLAARVADLVSRLGNNTHGSFFKTQQDAISELGVPSWNWYTEGLHGLINADGFCLNDTASGTTRCASSFPAAGVLGATFNRSLLRAVGSAIGDEIRAFSNANASWTAGKPVDPACVCTARAPAFPPPPPIPLPLTPPHP